ncbi:uncharacterized protein LOC127872383 [Dreissena polymorpha]|uniref:uncharacterized protein LOC127872383 n=1 Tax=Dreissena polymorpha TaxID=45954 RepID=UPI0022649586|nr:uncharacterized protein LOC127872383 [Dreissena polymorpha]
MIVGAYFQRGNHWNLLVIEPKKKVLYFYNSLGETAFQQRHMLQNWKNFLGRTLNDNKNWRLEVPVHSKQTDGFNCGIYIVMFAEDHILGLPCIFEKKDVLNKRKEIAATLLLYEGIDTFECYK